MRSTDWKWTAVDRRRCITAAEGHGTSKSTGWPRQRWTKSPRLRQLAEWKETKKIRSLFLHVLVQSSYILDVVGTFWIWSSTNMPRSRLPALGSSRAFDFVWLCHLCDLRDATHDHCSTRQASGMTCESDVVKVMLWKWCNGKAIEALAGRRPTARLLSLRKLVFVRLPLLP